MCALRLSLATTVILALSVGIGGGDAALATDDASARPPIASSGCGRSIIEPGTYLDEAMDVQGFTRRWAAYVPLISDGQTPLPVWLYLHGAGGNRNVAAQALQPEADEFRFLAVTPQARGGGWLTAGEHTDLDLSLENPDAVFLIQVLDHVATDLCIDLARIYVVGNSIGAIGASILACIPEARFAAIAPVAGVVDVVDACLSDRAMPTLAIHGTGDGIMPFAGAEGGVGSSPAEQALLTPSVLDRVAGIAARNGCQPGPEVETISDRIERSSWICPPGAEVELLIHDGGHGMGPVGYETIFEFFRQHAMPEGWMPAG